MISMSVRKGALAAVVALALMPTTSIAQNKPAPAATPAAIVQPKGNFIGDPKAAHTLTEFVSYTCPHCAHFAIEGDGPLKLAYIPTKKLRVEVRTFIRNPIDMAAALLVHCGDAKNFDRLHTMFMTRQSTWIQNAQKANQAQQQRWSTGPIPARLRAIASDMGFYDMMETQGYGRPEVDRCLADEAMVKRMIESTQAAYEGLHVDSTPSFALDGKLIAGVHSWDMLKPVLDKRLGFAE